MAYQLPQRPNIASRRLTATLIGIYAIIILLVLLLSTESNGNINSENKSRYSTTASKQAVIKPATSYSN